MDSHDFASMIPFFANVEVEMLDMVRRNEIDANYDFFQRRLATLLPTHRGQYALLKSARLEGFFERPGQAYRAGLDRFEDGLFSIQEVTDEPLHLGFLSVAGA